MKKNSKGTGYMRKRENGTWEGQYYVEGVRKSIYDTNFQALRKRLNDINTDLMNESYVEVSTGTLSDWLFYWLEHFSKPVTRQSTYISYETYIRAHISPLIGNTKIKNLSADILQKFFNEKSINGRLDGKPGGLAVKTLRNMKNMLHLSLEQAIINGILVKNVTKSVKLQKTRKKEMRVLSVKEQALLEEAVRSSTEEISWGIILALYTGIRIGEMLALTWADIDEQKNVIHINNSLRRQSRMNAINSDDYTVISNNEENKTALMIGPVKTLKGNREIFLPDDALEALEHFKEWHKNTKLLSGSNFNKHNLIICMESGMPIDARYYQDVFARIVKKAGIRQANFHCTRHTFATRALERGANLNTLADILGHAQASTTLNMYGHSFAEGRKKLMTTFNSTNNT